MRKQQGFTFWSLAYTIGTIAIIAMLTLKLFPAYMEFFAVRKAINHLASGGSLDTMSKSEIQRAFQSSTDVEYNITHIKASELEIRRSSDGTNVVTAEYEVVVPLVANISALLEFRASTDDKLAALKQ